MRVPEGQTSVFYDVEKTVLASEKRKALDEDSRRVAAAENPPAVEEDERKESSTK